MNGYLANDALGGRLGVERAVFNLFVDEGEVNAEPARHMPYRLWFADGVGRPLTLVGFKDIHHPVAAGSALRDVWAGDHHAASRGPRRPRRGRWRRRRPPGRGRKHPRPALRLRPPADDVPGQRPGHGRPSRAFEAFGGMFVGQLWEVFQPRLPWRTDH